MKIRFFNHAFLQIETKDFKFATDPWAIGPAFNTGWWLKFKTKKDWIEELNSCNFIYISHGPDHRWARDGTEKLDPIQSTKGMRPSS